MEGSDEKEKGKNKVTRVKTFPVPYALEGINNNFFNPTKQQTELSKEQIINQACKFHLQGNIQEAAKYYQNFINQGFKDYRVLSNYGALLGDLGKSKEAGVYLREAINLKPELAIAHSNLGTIYEDLGNRKEAMYHWKIAVKLNPKSEKSLKILALNLCYERNYELALKYLNLNQSDSCQSLYLGCLLSLDKEEEFNQKYDELSRKKACNADIGAVVEHAKIIYGKKYKSPFCNEAMKYILIDKINEELFSKEHLNQLISYTTNHKTQTKSQGTLHGGVQTSGNLFTLDLPFIKSIKNALEEKIEIYKNNFKNSGQGFINNWPRDYELRSWMISMKTGGFLAPHNHEYGWITGSYYLQLPTENINSDAGNISFSYEGPQYPNKGKSFNSSVIKLKERDICIFPSSLFHKTIPFESTKERICFVFDLIKKY